MMAYKWMLFIAGLTTMLYLAYYAFAGMECLRRGAERRKVMEGK
jgi:hypothetical protein